MKKLGVSLSVLIICMAAGFTAGAQVTIKPLAQLGGDMTEYMRQKYGPDMLESFDGLKIKDILKASDLEFRSLHLSYAGDCNSPDKGLINIITLNFSSAEELNNPQNGIPYYNVSLFLKDPLDKNSEFCQKIYRQNQGNVPLTEEIKKEICKMKITGALGSTMEFVQFD